MIICGTINVRHVAGVEECLSFQAVAVDRPSLVLFGDRSRIPVNYREYEYHRVVDNPVRERVFRSTELSLKTTSEKQKPQKWIKKKKKTTRWTSRLSWTMTPRNRGH